MDQADRNRVLWHSRRGMLELDLLLEPFARQRFERLDMALQTAYRKLLNNEDQDLYAWLVLGKAPVDQSLVEIIRLILAQRTEAD